MSSPDPLHANDNSSVPRARIQPVHKSIRVGVGLERAFEAFTAEIGEWWPLKTHSIGEDNAVTCAIDPREGGRVFETLANGDEVTWGRVLVWAPPNRLVFSWHLSSAVETASEVEIKFVVEGDDATRVELEHRRWELYGGERARALRDGYDKGWEIVLGKDYGDYVAKT